MFRQNSIDRLLNVMLVTHIQHVSISTAACFLDRPRYIFYRVLPNITATETAPAAPSVSAIASPSPWPAPVTTTTLSATLCLFILHFPLADGLDATGELAGIHHRIILWNVESIHFIGHDLLLDQMAQHMDNMQLYLLNARGLVRRNNDVHIG